MATTRAVKKRVAVKAAPAPRERKQLDESNISYFASGDSKPGMMFVSTGCAILDSVLGGGYVLGRIANLVGDKSTGKTLMAIEACANFARTYPKLGTIRYAEAEAAFDLKYAAALGMPTNKVTFAENMLTVEDFYEDLLRHIEENKDKPSLYVLDSLDALSDRAEQGRTIDQGSYGANKPKKLGELFRRLTQKLEHSKVLLIIISQIRDKIGVTFGETKMRTGGRALDFYASQVLWLTEIEKMKRTIDKVERVTGIRVKAMCKKNKVGLPYRYCEFPIVFGYGVDDLTANVEWLIDVGKESALTALGLSKAGYKVRLNNLRNKGGEEVKQLREDLRTVVKREWARVETGFLPSSPKY
jgi:protein RecA